ncbi:MULTISPECIES: hydantoinase B/oxoprolinase family protein [Brenneria]|uniref:Hydantoinase B/oxoprolinase family protein n=1 Tax=Brenneria nigrifluens DSM 30175 = ATCC 13028 TaxID=1121120 RepID=A0A2U1UAV4_9GAMM|nr:MULTISPECIES: hydantoinase B/oxoprolinase family protein [Brenneria]EHD21753.1 5-oxoprolinase (ATP-hydrolyzing) [Brenneria sp. EniD312]PWC18742.1 hydantoinase B/oxoprolinase family protein [Brenneria nigrifluens DSM 30175 = ATCC 13028]QCR04864.1 hydantoinase B/oxoprolinase family protein [Brenneria nigrifluens DSM 30175 = ATCC 13028]
MKLDPVTLEILNNKLTALTEEMCHTLQRTGRTLYVKETADFCCALADRDGRFFAYPRGIGVSGFVGLNCLAAIQAVGALQPGDVILTNDPYRSRGLATHLPDLQVIEPYFHQGEIIAYGWAFLHASDVGGNVPSSISPTNSDLFQEGLQIPPLKLVRGGELNQDIILLLRANSRTPDANHGDLQALLAALAAGRRRLAGIVARHGADGVLAAQRDLPAYSASRARQALRRIPDGHYQFSDYLDDEAGSGLPVRLALKIAVDDGNIHLDFSGTDPQVAAAINIPSHGEVHSWLTLRILALVCTLDKTVPLNAGLLAPITLFAPPGSLVNPLYPAAVGVRHAAAVRINDVLNGVLGQALPDIMPAASGGAIIPLVVAQRSERGQNVQVIEPMVGGGGGRFGCDGVDGRDNSISNLANNPVEMVEAETAVEIREYALRADSAGAGQWRGGCGQQIRVRILQDDTLILARGMERLRFQPWGAQGGLPGAATRLTLNAQRDDARALGKIDLLPVKRGDEILLQTAGGGGWGDPFLRDAERVTRDVALGLVSAAAARELYGVVLNNLQIDVAATARARQSIRQNSSRGAHWDNWRQIFDSDSLDRLNAALYAHPLSQRSRLRREFYAAILAQLPADFPQVAPDPQMCERIRQQWPQRLLALQQANNRLSTD